MEFLRCHLQAPLWIPVVHASSEISYICLASRRMPFLWWRGETDSVNFTSTEIVPQMMQWCYKVDLYIANMEGDPDRWLGLRKPQFWFLCLYLWASELPWAKESHFFSSHLVSKLLNRGLHNGSGPAAMGASYKYRLPGLSPSDPLHQVEGSRGISIFIMSPWWLRQRGLLSLDFQHL